MGAFQQLAQGMLAGQQLHMQLQRAADEHQQLQQELAEQATRASITDTMNHLAYMGMSRPVTGGTVQDQMNAPDTDTPATPGTTIPGQSGGGGKDTIQGTAPDVTSGALPALTIPGQSYTYFRKPDASRLVTYKDSQGNSHQYELLTPQEQLQRKIALDASGAFAQAQLNAQVAYLGRRAALGLPGNAVQVSDAVTSALGLPRGYQATLAEMPEIASRYDAMRKASRMTNAPGTVTTQQPFGLQPDNTAPPGSDAGTGGGTAPAAQPLGTENLFATPGSLLAGQIPTGQPPTAAAQPGASQTGTTQPGGAQVIATGGPRLPEGEFERDFLPAYAGKLGKTVDKLTPDEKIAAFGDFAESKADPTMRALAVALKQNELNLQPTKNDAKSIADMIHAHKMAPSQLAIVGGFGTAGQALKRMVMTDLAGRGDNLEELESEFDLAKQPGFQQTIRYMDQVNGSIPRLISSANQLGNTNMRAINQLVNAGKNQFNSVDLKAFKTDVTLVGDEVAKILQGGGTGSGTSDAKLKQAQEIFASSDSPAAIAAAAKEVQALITSRRQALTRGTYLEQKGSSTPQATHRYNPATRKIEAIQQ